MNITSRPNILVVSIESIDGRALSCLDFPGVRTPVLDGLAEEGALFATTYCPSPVCVPSRAATFAGRDLHRIGAWNNFNGLPEDQPTFLTLLAQQGYLTGDLGRRDLRSGAHTQRCRMSGWTRASGIDLPMVPPHRRREIPGEVGFPWDWNNLRGENPWNAAWNLSQWLDRAVAQDKPFVLHYGIGAVHTGAGYNAAQAYVDRIDAAAVRLPPWEDISHPALRIQAARKNRTARLADEEVLAARRNYLAAILEVDAMIAFIRAELTRTGQADNTILIIHGDHGDLQLEHGHQWAKNSAYEASARVPLIIHGPGLRRGVRVDHPVSLIDLLPTILDLAGAPPAPATEGHSLAPYLCGGTAPHPHAVLCQYHNGMLPTGMFMWRRDQWKYIAYAGMAPQLFDLKADPDELTDLAPSRPELIAQLDAELRRRIDYPAVDAAVKELDRAWFHAWWHARPEIEREQELAAIFGAHAPFTAAHRERLLDWAGLA